MISAVSTRTATLLAASRRRAVAIAGDAVWWTIFAVILLQVVWQLRDHAAASYDQSSYLRIAHYYVDVYDRRGLTSIPRAILDRDPGRAPLYPLLITPLVGLVGPRVDSAQALGLITFPLLLLGVGEIAVRLAGRRARLPAVVMTATMPLMYGLAREVLVDMTLTALSALTILCALRSDGLRRRRWSILLGLALGFTSLTKVTAPAFVLIPCVLAILLRERPENRTNSDASTGSRAVNAGLAIIAAVAVAAWWYVPNREATLTYIRATTSGDLALGAGPDHPFGLRPFLRFLVGAFNQHLGWPVVIAATAAIVISWRLRVERLRTGESRRRDLIAGALLLAWGLIPTLIVGLGPNQDVRLVAAAVPSIAVLAGCAIAGLDHTRSRAILVPTAIAATLGLLVHTFSISTINISAQIDTPVGGIAYVVGEQTQGYARVPVAHDNAASVLLFLHDQATVRTPGRPAVVGLLQTHQEINPNTLVWEAEALGVDNVTIVEVGAEGLDDAAFEAQFAALDAIVIIPDLPGADRLSKRQYLLNLKLAAARISDEQLAKFSSGITNFPIAAPGSTAQVRWQGAP